MSTIQERQTTAFRINAALTDIGARSQYGGAHVGRNGVLLISHFGKESVPFIWKAVQIAETDLSKRLCLTCYRNYKPIESCQCFGMIIEDCRVSS